MTSLPALSLHGGALGVTASSLAVRVHDGVGHPGWLGSVNVVGAATLSACCVTDFGC